MRADLDVHEQQHIVHVLKEALKRLQDRQSLPTTAQGHPSPITTTASPTAPIVQVTASETHATPSMKPHLRPQSYQPLPARASSLSTEAPNNVEARAQNRPVATRAPPVQPAVQRRDPAPRAVDQAPVLYQPAAAPAPALQWRPCWRTSAEEHNHRSVQSAWYAAELQGLPGGDGHAGWLVSGSEGLLNLWECSASGGRDGEPSLQLMHSQVVDHQPTSMDADHKTQLLLSASGGAQCRVSLHALNPEAGFLAPRRVVALNNHMHAGASASPRVASLSSGGSHLSSHFAASLGAYLHIYDIGASASHSPLVAWKADNADVTVLHKSHHAAALFSGSAKGTIHLWDLHQKPSKPVTTWTLPRKVTSLEMVTEHLLLSSSEDGQLVMWDVRKGGTPRKPVSRFQLNNGSPVRKCCVSPLRDSVAVVTPKELLCVQLVSSSSFKPVASIVSGQQVFVDVLWNTATGEIVATGDDGSVSVFRDFRSR